MIQAADRISEVCHTITHGNSQIFARKWLKPRPEFGLDWLMCANIGSGHMEAALLFETRMDPMAATAPMPVHGLLAHEQPPPRRTLQ